MEDLLNNFPAVLTISDVAEILNIPEATARRHIMINDIPHIIIGRLVRITKDAMISYLQGEAGVQREDDITSNKPFCEGAYLTSHDQTHIDEKEDTMNKKELFAEYNDVLRPEDVQNALHVGRNTVYKYLADGIIKSIRIGNQYRIPKQYLIDFLYPPEEILS